ncbi:MAG: hypothetical protein RIM99_09875 [Cyclobacteriaceae bacterium]
MRNIIIKAARETSQLDQEEEFISFDYERSFVALLLVINVISGFILYQFIG